MLAKSEEMELYLAVEAEHIAGRLKLSSAFHTHSESSLFVAFNTRTKNTLCCTQQARDRDEPDFDEQN
jgi:hypothetical protein